jgi:tRNA pseudouridine32 synthase/23S rRNA pseudouridine746 synthase
METPQHLELHLPVEETGLTPLDILPSQTGLSRQQLKQVMQKGALWMTPGDGTIDPPRRHNRHTQRLRRAKRTLQKGDTLHLYYDADILSSEPPAAILIDDQQQYSVWYKPPGMFSQGSKWSDHGSIGRWVQRHLSSERAVFLVHRLDRATRGLMVLAHSKKTARALTLAFEERKTRKHYQAIVVGQFPDQPLSCKREIDGRSACSHFERLAYDSQTQRSLLNVTIETGRKHQFRRHLTALDFPIVGDRLHGSAQEGDPDLQLCAWRLEFPCPRSGEIRSYVLEPKLRLPF